MISVPEWVAERTVDATRAAELIGGLKLIIELLPPTRADTPAGAATSR